MQNAFSVTAVADSLDEQEFVLRREAQRLFSLTVRASADPTNQSWRGLARDGFDRELSSLQHALSVALTAVEEALANTVRARESVQGSAE